LATIPAPRFRTDYEQLQKIASCYGAQAANARRSLQQVKNQMDALQRGDWIGQGARAFYKEMGQDVLPSMLRLVEALARAQQVTDQIGKIVQEPEEEAARQLRGEGIGAGTMGALGLNLTDIQSTPTPITTPTPTPSRTATPVPPGWVPPTPTPTGTPTAEEIQAAYDERRERWLSQLGEEIFGCGQTPDPMACAAAVGSTIYLHHGWDLIKLALSGEDNPLADESDEVALMAHPILQNAADPVVSMLVRRLGLSTGHVANFEPAFVEALKKQNPQVYGEVLAYAQKNAEEMGLTDEAIAEILKDLVEGPFLDMRE